MEEILYNAGIGALASFFLAGGSYLKAYNASGDKEGFKLGKFLKSIVLGAAVGGVAGGTGMAPQLIVAMPAYAGLEVFVENLVKSVLRRLS